MKLAGKCNILNSNCSLDEINSAIRPLKNGKCPGIDFFPAEFLKAGIESLSPILQLMYNYFLENRHFPSCWCEGLSIALFKAGDRLDPACYRKLTILPAFEKVFEIIFNNRFEFVNEAFQKIDRLNNGFLKGSRCSDNMFIFQSIVTRQLNLSKPLYVCFVDFSSAFDLVNRNILFLGLSKPVRVAVYWTRCGVSFVKQNLG